MGKKARRQVSADMLTLGGSFWTLFSAFVDELALTTACHPQTAVVYVSGNNFRDLMKWISLPTPIRGSS